MKTLLFLFVAAVLIPDLSAQSIVGRWEGKLKVQGTELTIVFNIEKDSLGYSSTLDSPDQGAYGIKVDSTFYNAPDLRLVIIMLGASYEGDVNADESISGTFSQAGMSFSLDLMRNEEKPKIIRPQEPVAPYPYEAEEVTFFNEKEGISLSGTLTYPSGGGKHPAVVLITGSGPQNRDEELFNHKPFLVLADHLTKNGIAVLRYDERGVGKSEGDFISATTFDFANDVEAALDYLLTRQEIKQEAVGLIGHSEGGIIAPIVASRNEKISFIVLLAGTAISGDRLLNLQREYLLKASGVDQERISQINLYYDKIYQIIQEAVDGSVAESQVMDFLNKELDENPYATTITGGLSKEVYLKQIKTQMLNPWMMAFIKYDPAPMLENVKCPVLALNGSKDLQVPADPNLTLIKTQAEKGGNQEVTIKELSGLNHLFQTCETGLPMEYAQIEETFAPMALQEISDWVLKLAAQ